MNEMRNQDEEKQAALVTRLTEAGKLNAGAFMAKLKRVSTRIPFADDALAAFYCVRDPATPKTVRAVLIGALGYFVVPTDMIPDFIAAVGFTDDAVVLMKAISTVSSHITPDHKSAAVEKLENWRGG